MTLIGLAQRMWAAYSEQAEGKTFDGKPLPTWEELGRDRQQCWLAAAHAAAEDFDQEAIQLIEKLSETRKKYHHLLMKETNDEQ